MEARILVVSGSFSIQPTHSAFGSVLGFFILYWDPFIAFTKSKPL